MTTQQGKELLQQFTSKAEQDKDPYFIVHFSRTDDYFKGYHEGLDVFDASIIVSELVKHFGPEILTVADFHSNKKAVH